MGNYRLCQMGDFANWRAADLAGASDDVICPNCSRRGEIIDSDDLTDGGCDLCAKVCQGCGKARYLDEWTGDDDYCEDCCNG